MEGLTWQDIAAKVQQYRDASIARIQPPLPEVSSELPLSVTAIPRQVLTEEEVTITESTPERLIELLAKGTLSSVKVVSAFLRSAGLAQKLVNCVTEVMPEQALERARCLDRYLAEHNKPTGPLHGLPISVKEHISIEGLTCNCGFVVWHDCVAKSNAFVVQLLEQAGAILYVRTTEPQSLMHLETSSNLYGVTVNPHNRHLTCGGSSGGEGALIGLKGSCLGIGSDIGGSIRAPAALNGLWGFRPTGHRLPLGGVEAAMKGYDSITPVIGPMSASFEGLNIFMKAVIDQKPWTTEPTLIPMPWRYPSQASHLIKSDGSRRLRVAFLWDDDVVRPHPPVHRALSALAGVLKSDPNIMICDWKPYKHDHAWDVITSLYFPDGAAENREIMAESGEPLRPLSKWILDEHPNVKEYTISELWQLNQQRDKYRAEYAALWNSTALDNEYGDMVDVIISPVEPGVAPPLDNSKYWSYTSQWNLLDYPAMAFPYGTVDQRLDKLTEEHKAYNPRNKQDAVCWSLWRDRHGAAGYQDAPISLQITARTFEDEKVFEAMEWIKRSARF